MRRTTATSLKLPVALKRRIDRLARQEGHSPHALMIEALTVHVEDAERRQAFIEDALEAEHDVAASGAAYLLEDVVPHVLRKSRGEPSRRPKAKAWPR